MKGHDAYKRVLNLLGYLNNDDLVTSDISLYNRALHAFNQILLDLKKEEISDLSQEINITKAECDALIYGVAMMLSLACGDGERNRIFTDIYNAKRSTVLSGIDTVSDVMPTTVGGEV